MVHESKGRAKPHSDILTLKEAAEYLRVHENTLLKLAAANKVPVKRLVKGKKKSLWRFSRTALEKYMGVV